jgi:hypothetical protein
MIVKCSDITFVSVSVGAYICISPIVARQRLGKNPSIVSRLRRGRNVPAEMNTQAKIEEMLDVSFSMWPV